MISSLIDEMVGASTCGASADSRRYYGHRTLAELIKRHLPAELEPPAPEQFNRELIRRIARMRASR